MALVIIIDSMDSMTIEEHAKSSVKRLIRHTDPFAPRLPDKSDVFMRHHCEEGHSFWGPAAYSGYLCPEHLEDPAVREKHGLGSTKVEVSLVQAAPLENGKEEPDGHE